VTISSEPETWRQLLALRISDLDERRRIAQLAGVDEVTLKRYAEGKTKRIRPHLLRPLVAAWPSGERPLLTRLILEEFPDFVASEQPDASFLNGLNTPEAPTGIALDVYERALRAYTTTPLSLRFWVISHLVLGAALEQLDPGPHPVGIEVVIVQCMRCSHSESVGCLRETCLLGTPPWRTDQATQLFLGAESLSGYAVTTARPAICQNLRTNPAFLPVRLEAYEESAAAYPLLQGERVGGCLLVATTQVDFFTPPRLQLINAYADLAVLALLDDQFYENQAIQLRTMPASDVQQAHFASFRRRVNELISAPDRRVADIVQAEQLVWSQLAEELMGLNP
jgi:GAF domain